jgi:glycosyltransferase involved in cell wall biosynthesis
MCELEKERSWKVDYATFHFPYYVDKGIDIYKRGISNHWNPMLIKMMRREKDSAMILGGSWNALDVIAICVLKRLHLIKQEIIFWSEANYLTIGSRKKNVIRDFLRSFVYNTGEGRVIVPGRMAELSFEKWGISNKRFIRLPNVIEEEIVNPSLFESRVFTPLSEFPHFVMPVRLNERIKGIMNFFNAIGPDNVKKAIFEVLGNGDDEELIRSYIKDNGYEDHIFLCGFCNMETVVSYYKRCDVMLLPSYSDPSPLSLVEACCAKLPILASNRCGNHYETVIEGVNGYTFDPENHQEIKDAYEKMISRRSQWKEMGEQSYGLFDNNFRQSVVLPRFVAQLQHI